MKEIQTGLRDTHSINHCIKFGQEGGPASEAHDCAERGAEKVVEVDKTGMRTMESYFKKEPKAV